MASGAQRAKSSAARHGAARRGSARLGSARRGSARLGAALRGSRPSGRRARGLALEARGWLAHRCIEQSRPLRMATFLCLSATT